MSYRVFMTIQRGTMDKTAVCVFPWERPILEEIHGGGAQVVGIEEMSSLKGASKVVTVKLKSPKTELAPGLKEQLEAMAAVTRDDDPFHNLEEEYGRLQDKYGKHPQIDMSVTEKVFGSVMNFRSIVRAYRGNTPPKVDPLYPDTETEELEPQDEDLVPAEMSREQLKAELRRREIDYAFNAPTEKLIDMLTEAITATA